jgi:hypothetical protein
VKRHLIAAGVLAVVLGGCSVSAPAPGERQAAARAAAGV